ncbi:MAG: hypothetical protein SF029_17695 [bacterium]|nr:hypothetical protein [bacterium]
MYNELGSLRFVTNNTGIATYNASYTPYGELLQSYGTSAVPRLRITREYTDPSGMVRLEEAVLQ